MIRRVILAGLMCVAAAVTIGTATEARAQQHGQPADWQRFYYYPYIYYPHNFQRPVEYNSLYYRYPAERQIPVFNKDWYNHYTAPKPWYKGHHYILDTI